MKSYVVVGMGRFGSEAAVRLCQLGCEVLAVDTSQELVDAISRELADLPPVITFEAEAPTWDPETDIPFFIQENYLNNCENCR